MQEQKENSKKKLLKGQKDFLKYSGTAFKMMAIIGAGAYGGHLLDMKYPNTYSLFTVILSLLAVAAAMYSVIKDLTSGE